MNILRFPSYTFFCLFFLCYIKSSSSSQRSSESSEEGLPKTLAQENSGLLNSSLYTGYKRKSIQPELEQSFLPIKIRCLENIEENSMIEEIDMNIPEAEPSTMKNENEIVEELEMEVERNSDSNVDTNAIPSTSNATLNNEFNFSFNNEESARMLAHHFQNIVEASLTVNQEHLWNYLLPISNTIYDTFLDISKDFILTHECLLNRITDSLYDATKHMDSHSKLQFQTECSKISALLWDTYHLPNSLEQSRKMLDETENTGVYEFSITKEELHDHISKCKKELDNFLITCIESIQTWEQIFHIFFKSVCKFLVNPVKSLPIEDKPIFLNRLISGFKEFIAQIEQQKEQANSGVKKNELIEEILQMLNKILNFLDYTIESENAELVKKLENSKIIDFSLLFPLLLNFFQRLSIRNKEGKSLLRKHFRDPNENHVIEQLNTLFKQEEMLIGTWLSRAQFVYSTIAGVTPLSEYSASDLYPALFLRESLNLFFHSSCNLVSMKKSKTVLSNLKFIIEALYMESMGEVASSSNSQGGSEKRYTKPTPCVLESQKFKLLKESFQVFDNEFKDYLSLYNLENEIHKKMANIFMLISSTRQVLYNLSCVQELSESIQNLSEHETNHREVLLKLKKILLLIFSTHKAMECIIKRAHNC